jgi:Fcf1
VVDFIIFILLNLRAFISESLNFLGYRYILVSQDPKMREVAREIAGTPILYLYGQAPTLEKPSTYNEHQAQKKDEIR